MITRGLPTGSPFLLRLKVGLTRHVRLASIQTPCVSIQGVAPTGDAHSSLAIQLRRALNPKRMPGANKGGRHHAPFLLVF